MRNRKEIFLYELILMSFMFLLSNSLPAIK
jgi:hypothetical protein